MAPFNHKKNDSTRILSDLAPVTMTPRMIISAATVSSRPRTSLAASSIQGGKLGFSTLGRAPLRLSLGSKRITSSDLQIFEDIEELLEADVPEPEGVASNVSLLRGFNATIPSAEQRRTRRRQMRNIDNPKLGLKRIGLGARGLLTEEEEESQSVVSEEDVLLVKHTHGRKKKGRESLSAAKMLGKEELTRQTQEVLTDKENVHVKRSLINSEIEEITHKIQALTWPDLPSLQATKPSHPECDYDPMSDDPLSTFGCRTLIEQYLHSGTLSTLIISGIGNLPLQTILNSPTLKCLHLYQCFVAHGETQLSEGSYRLTKLSAERCSNIKFASIARCTDLEEIELDSEALVLPSTQEMTSLYQAKWDQQPFIQLKAGKFTTLPKWDFILDAVGSIGKPGSGGRCKDLDGFLSHTPALQTHSWKGQLPKHNELSPSVEVLSLVRLPALKRLSIALSYTVHKEQGEGSAELALCIRNAACDIQWLTDIAMDEDSSRFPALEDVDLSVELWKNASLLDNIEWVHSELVKDLQPRFDRLTTNARIRYKTKLERSEVVLRRSRNPNSYYIILPLFVVTYKYVGEAPQSSFDSGSSLPEIDVVHCQARPDWRVEPPSITSMNPVKDHIFFPTKNSTSGC
ncbi:hypothetical protein BJ165DRAFT_1599200 [Panaeolus papilionaceus]|nr:hypothetical protein BJ165DRAFT_1599200 [Panaeolus papilionaceus]